MARPKKEGMDYFPHDTDAVGDDKVEAMMALYGNDGYAFYFILLERIYRSANGELDVSNFTIRTNLIKKLGISQEQFHPMLEAAFEIGMFDRKIYETRQCITSNGVKKRHSEVEKMRDKWRSKKDKDGENSSDSGENTGENGVISGDNESREEFSPEKSAQRKVKESKSSKNNKNIRTNSPDSESDDSDYSDDFKQFWLVYPRKTGKKVAYNKWLRLIKAKKDSMLLIQCAENYSAHCRINGTEERFMLHGSTFLDPKNERYTDFLEPPVQTAKAPINNNQTKDKFSQNKDLLLSRMQEGRHDRRGNNRIDVTDYYSLPTGTTE
ncbi:hypothetical protein BK124_00570 [Paenibacillus amylolyticus]|uniref:DUF4373 domain-containing protein n=1 Tax=Paenibacillus amylolyticus TaxID=1451 RepID=UPI00096EC28B|nr:DUF4373 domain-containing protein [Paenibacillus amylolyticus]OMF01206.1 hypothetical protein BK124_00570 [Paenibacillus amylolyticus]